MSFFHRRTKNKKVPETARNLAEEVAKTDKIEEAWEDIPGWIESTDLEEIKTVSIISSAIAMADRPDGKFTIKKVWQRNPEAERVAVLAAAVTTITEENKLTIKSIKTRCEMRPL
ncbi:MAG: hypothetical protein LBV19_09380 [Streptococcaceae bacterium]|nr:hypothetical protein [Streptococcaceae bacterium]